MEPTDKNRSEIYLGDSLRSVGIAVSPTWDVERRPDEKKNLFDFPFFSSSFSSFFYFRGLIPGNEVGNLASIFFYGFEENIH